MADITKTYETDPNRCQANIATKGQCLNLAHPGSQYCIAHGGNKAAQAAAKQSLHNYRLNVWNQRVTEFAENDHIKSLRGEIGILRLLMEERLNQCKSSLDLMIHSQPLSDLVMKLDKLVNSCHNLENKLSMTLDKAAVLQLASVILEIIGQHIDDEDIMNDIAAQIANAITEGSNSPAL